WACCCAFWPFAGKTTMPSDVDRGLDGGGDVAAGAWANTGAPITSRTATAVDLRMPIIGRLPNVATRRRLQRPRGLLTLQPLRAFHDGVPPGNQRDHEHVHLQIV